MVGNNSTAQDHILIALHDSGVGGHSGISATYARVRQLFAWPNLKQTVQDFVRECQICQQAKTERIKTFGLYSHCQYLNRHGKLSTLTLWRDCPSLISTMPF
jgi:hypothetical protein